MNLKDKRTRRIAAACASAIAVTAGGVTVGASLAGATGSLSLATSNAFTALNLGASTTVASSVQTLQASTGLSGTDSFTLTYGGQTTSSLAKSATFTEVETALNALSTVKAAGGVTVTKTGAGADLQTTTAAYVITFNVAGLRTAVTVTVTQAGGGAGVAAVATAGGSNTLGSGSSLAAALANATFGTKVTTSAVGSLSLRLDSYTAPSGVTVSGTPHLLFAQQASGSATGPATGWSGLSNPAGTGSYAPVNGAQDVFLTATKPGTYAFHFADDNNSVGTGDDAVSPTVTMTVLDGYATTAETSDDWAPVVSATPTSTTFGESVSASVPFAPVTLVDTRSSNSGIGVLGSKLAAVVGAKFTSSTGGLNTNLSAGGTDYTAPAALTATATGGTRTLAAGVSATAGTIVSTATFDRDGNGTLTDAAVGTTAQTLVATNGVTGITAPAVTAVTGSVVAGTNAATIKSGHATATYNVTVTDAGTKTDDVVVFTLTPHTNTPGLSGTGTLVSNVNGVKKYAVTADADGVASITVTSDKTTAGAAYRVDASSNGYSGTQLTATYADKAPTSVKVTNTSASLNVVSGQSVNLSGKLLDQFGATFVPGSTDSQSVQLFLGTAASGCSAYALAGGPGTAIGLANAQKSTTDGTFTFAYTPASTPTPGYCTKFTFGFDANKDGSIADSNTERIVGTITWASTTAVHSVTMTPASTTPAVATYGGGPVVSNITGTAVDSLGTGLAYKKVTLTGDQGVYFAEDNTGLNLVSSIDVATDSSGNWTAYAVYTKTGAAKIKATSESKSAEATVTVGKPAASERYMVSVNNVSALPNSTVIVTGKIVDIFGNPVMGVTPSDLELTGDTVSLGVLGAPSTTNNGGEFSATFIAGSTTGKVFLSAKIWAGVQKVPATSWLTTGALTLPKSNSVATATLTIAADSVSLNASAASVVGAKGITLSGTTRPNVNVDVYLKNVGEPLSLVDSVMSGSDGTFSVPVTVTRNSTFIAKTATATSSAATVKVVSTAKISARTLGKGKVRVSVSGGPSKTGTIVLWQRLRGGKLVKLDTYTTHSGAASWKITTGKGSKTYRATYTASGAATSAVVSVTVIL